ncbi:hypothetical protein, partial [Xanthomonas citri]|uniref:hypothetical protein n=1 Tax=Xanthomonas citri TaxID=346 RepID=UPI001A97C386
VPHARTFFHRLAHQALDLAGRNVGKPQHQNPAKLGQASTSKNGSGKSVHLTIKGQHFHFKKDKIIFSE